MDEQIKKLEALKKEIEEKHAEFTKDVEEFEKRVKDMQEEKTTEENPVRRVFTSDDVATMAKLFGFCCRARDFSKAEALRAGEAFALFLLVYWKDIRRGDIKLD